MATAAQRKHLCALMDHLVQDEPLVHYPPGDRRTRTIHQIATEKQMLAELHAGRLTIDCSQSVTMLCHVAGLKDPNGNAYRDDGYTGTLLEHLRHYSNPASAMPGALVVFGGGTGHHVCMVRKAGKNPLLFSHGQERGPFMISLSEEAKYQPKPITFLSVAPL